MFIYNKTRIKTILEMMIVSGINNCSICHHLSKPRQKKVLYYTFLKKSDICFLFQVFRLSILDFLMSWISLWTTATSTPNFVGTLSIHLWKTLWHDQIIFWILLCLSDSKLNQLKVTDHVSLPDSPGVNGMQVATGQQLLPCCEEQQFFSFISLSKQT